MVHLKPNLAAMLARACLCDNAALPHTLDQKPLAHDIVCFVRARVIQVFPLDINTRPPEMPCEVPRKGKGCGPARIGGHDIQIFVPEAGITLGLFKGIHEFFKGGREYLRDERPPQLSIVSAVNHSGSLHWQLLQGSSKSSLSDISHKFLHKEMVLFPGPLLYAAVYINGKGAYCRDSAPDIQGGKPP